MKPLDIACGVCHRPAGQPCVSPNGRERSLLHIVRTSAARRVLLALLRP